MVSFFHSFSMLISIYRLHFRILYTVRMKNGTHLKIATLLADDVWLVGW